MFPPQFRVKKSVQTDTHTYNVGTPIVNQWVKDPHSESVIGLTPTANGWTCYESGMYCFQVAVGVSPNNGVGGGAPQGPYGAIWEKNAGAEQQGIGVITDTPNAGVISNGLIFNSFATLISATFYLVKGDTVRLRFQALNNGENPQFILAGPGVAF